MKTIRVSHLLMLREQAIAGSRISAEGSPEQKLFVGIYTDIWDLMQRIEIGVQDDSSIDEDIT